MFGSALLIADPAPLRLAAAATHVVAPFGFLCPGRALRTVLNAIIREESPKSELGVTLSVDSSAFGPWVFCLPTLLAGNAATILALEAFLAFHVNQAKTLRVRTYQEISVKIFFKGLHVSAVFREVSLRKQYFNRLLVKLMLAAVVKTLFDFSHLALAHLCVDVFNPTIFAESLVIDAHWQFEHLVRLKI